MITTILYFIACTRTPKWEGERLAGLFMLACVEWAIVAFNLARIGA